MAALAALALLLLMDPLLALALIGLMYLLSALLRRRGIAISILPLLDRGAAEGTAMRAGYVDERRAGEVEIERGVKVLGPAVGKVPIRGALGRVLNNVRRRAAGARAAIDYKIPRGKRYPVSIPATLRRAAASGRFPRVGPGDLREKLYGGKGRLSVVVVLDTSASMALSLEGIREVLRSIREESFRRRDRISLVVSKGSGAVVVQRRTTNFYALMQRLEEVGLDGYTPLAAGMYEGLRIAVLEKRRGYTPVLLVVSDGNANVPLLEVLSDEVLLSSRDLALESVFAVARMLARSGIKSVFLNTRHVEGADGRESLFYLAGTQVMRVAARIAGGTYLGIVKEEE